MRRKFKGTTYEWAGGIGDDKTKEMRRKARLGQLFEKGIWQSGGRTIKLNIFHIRFLLSQGWIEEVK